MVENLRVLGARVEVCGLVGEDEAGGVLAERFAALDIDPAGLVVSSERPNWCRKPPPERLSSGGSASRWRRRWGIPESTASGRSCQQRAVSRQPSAVSRSRSTHAPPADG